MAILQKSDRDIQVLVNYFQIRFPKKRFFTTSTFYTQIVFFILFAWFHDLHAQSVSTIPSSIGSALSGSNTSRFLSLPLEKSGEKKITLPEPQLPESPQNQPKIKLPTIEPVSNEDQRISTSLSIKVNNIQLIGNTVFSEEELSSLIQPYENRTITSAELQEVRYQLTNYYVDRGYINSGAVVPDQKVKDGIIQIRIIEGELTGVNIMGNDWLRSSYIEKRIRHAKDSPLNIKNLQERLLLLQQDTLIDQILAELQPGFHPGESLLQVKIKEARPYQMGFEVSNDRSPSIGGIGGKIWLSHQNITGFGDSLYFDYDRTDGLDGFNGSYSLPLNAFDSRLSLYYRYNKASVVEEPFNELDISSRSETFGISISHPFYRTPRQTFSMAIGFEHRRSKTFLSGEPFSFSPGVPGKGKDKGESKISVIRFSQDWLDRSQDQVISARSTFNLGIDALSSTVNEGLPDGKFFTWLGQFQLVRRLPFWSSQLIFRSDVQLASTSLLPLEKFSVGGQHSVRGYRENQLVRDNGSVVSLEWRIPVFRLPISGVSNSINDGMVQLATFTDFGWSKNTDVSSQEPKTIGSWGLGLRWNPSHKVHTELYWGVPFRKISEKTEHDLQDSGVHFKLSMQLI